jgi:hypothetical protein
MVRGLTSKGEYRASWPIVVRAPWGTGYSDWGLEERLDVHRPVRNANDCDNAPFHHIENQVGSLALTPIALSDVISG